MFKITSADIKTCLKVYNSSESILVYFIFVWQSPLTGEKSFFPNLSGFGLKGILSLVFNVQFQDAVTLLQWIIGRAVGDPISESSYCVIIQQQSDPTKYKSNPLYLEDMC